MREPHCKSSTPKQSSGWNWVIYGSIAVTLLLAAREFHSQDRLRQGLLWVGQLGPRGPWIFIALYIAATILFVPGSALTLGAGALFGVVWGSVYVSIGSTLGATGAFLAGRYLARDAVARRIKGNQQFEALDKGVAKDGWKIVFLTRLSPAFPFTLLNYAFGLTEVKLSDYVVASWIGMMPGTVLYVYLGSLANAAAGQRNRTTGEWTFYGLGLLATLAVTLQVTRMARKALSGSMDKTKQRDMP